MKILSEREFDECLARARKALGRISDFPLSIFSVPPASLAFLAFDDLCSKELFEGVSHICRLNNDTGFVFMMTKPDPVEYYRRNYGRLPAASFSLADSGLDFEEFIWRDRKASPTGAIIIEADEIIIISDALSCAAYGHHDFELGVVASFSNYVDFANQPSFGSLALMNCAEAYDDHLNHFRKYTSFGRTHISRSEFLRSWTPDVR